MAPCAPHCWLERWSTPELLPWIHGTGERTRHMHMNRLSSGGRYWTCARLCWCRILFWTDWDASMPRIEAASMSGEGRKTIHKETGSGGWPNGLTVDYLERRILWIDAR